jgi:hypothetical protein
MRRKKFQKWCPKCRDVYGQYGHWWPTADETLDTGSIIYWSLVKMVHKTAGIRHAVVPVMCGDCQKVRTVPCSQIKHSYKSFGIYTGLCRACHRLVANEKVRAGWIKSTGRTMDSRGYIRMNLKLLSPDVRLLALPMIVRGTNYVLEHRIVMAQSLGRSLTKQEAVHHLNGIKHDNRIENLLLTNHLEHAKIEVLIYQSMKAKLDAANARIAELETLLSQ